MPPGVRRRPRWLRSSSASSASSQRPTCREMREGRAPRPGVPTGSGRSAGPGAARRVEAADRPTPAGLRRTKASRISAGTAGDPSRRASSRARQPQGNGRLALDTFARAPTDARAADFGCAGSRDGGCGRPCICSTSILARSAGARPGSRVFASVSIRLAASCRASGAARVRAGGLDGQGALRFAFTPAGRAAYERRRASGYRITARPSSAKGLADSERSRATEVRMKLVIHAGIHRTGTTSLQRMLAKNRAALAARGVAYPGEEAEPPAARLGAATAARAGRARCWRWSRRRGRRGRAGGPQRRGLRDPRGPRLARGGGGAASTPGRSSTCAARTTG